MRETRLSGSEGGAGSSPVPTPIDEGRKPGSWAGKPMPRQKKPRRGVFPSRDSSRRSFFCGGKIVAFT